MESSIFTESIKEGKASIFAEPNIFYNPVQEFNRDMSVAALRVFVENYNQTQTGLRKGVKRKCSSDSIELKSKGEEECESNLNTEGVIILEALSATGLRSVRYALEVPKIKQIYANDCSYKAVQSIKRNVKENNVEHLVTPLNDDAVWLMQKFGFENKRMDVIDLDPYGCPTRFLDSAVNCIEDGGLLMVTCTDMAVIAGNTSETCYVKYGAVSLRCSACHEMALRIALQCIASCCGRYGKYVIPLLSFSADFYIRLFLKVRTSQQNCKKVSSNISMVYQCNGCETLTLQPLGYTLQNEKCCKFSLPLGPPVSTTCLHCNHKHKLGGPIWSGKLHDEQFIEKMLAVSESDEFGTSKRMIGMLSVIKEELHDVPLYYTVNSLCAKMHCEMIPLRLFRCALLNGGYRVSMSHCKTNSLKTNAPSSVIWDIMRCWVKEHPVSEKRLNTSQVAKYILNQSPSYIADFSSCEGAIPLSSINGLLRFQMNPTPNWGPGTRPKLQTSLDGNASKKKRNQNKHSMKPKSVGFLGKNETETPVCNEDVNISCANDNT